MPRFATLKQASKQARHNCALFLYSETEKLSGEGERFTFVRWLFCVKAVCCG